VLVLDADLGLANLDVVLNLHPKITLHDVFTGKATLDEAILPAPGGFSVLLAGSGMVEYSRLTPEVRDKLLQIIDNVKPRFDWVHPGHRRRHLRRGAVRVSLASEVLVVATPEPTSLTDAYATIKVLATQQERRAVSLLVNQVSRPARASVIAASCSRWCSASSTPPAARPSEARAVGEVPPTRRARGGAASASCCWSTTRVATRPRASGRRLQTPWH
jgi:flagellar biosynthesis protein FlhG